MRGNFGLMKEDILWLPCNFRDPKVISSISAVTLVTYLCTRSVIFFASKEKSPKFRGFFLVYVAKQSKLFYCCDNFCTHKSEGVQLSV